MKNLDKNKIYDLENIKELNSSNIINIKNYCNNYSLVTLKIYKINYKNVKQKIFLAKK